MSDYEYEEEYQYDEEPQPEEEDISTKVELEYFQIEDLIRAGKIDKAVQELESLYKICEENNLKNYKIKILNQLLTIYSKGNKSNQVSTTLSRISELNKQEKFTENAVKSIVTIVRGANFSKNKKDILQFIEQFDLEIKMKAYMFLLERALDEKDKTESQSMFQIIQNALEENDAPSASIQLESYSLQIKYSKLMGIDISDKVHQMELKIPKLEAQAYMSEGHISVLKLAFAEIMFESGNYQNSANNIFAAFLQKAKYGSSAQLKQILKTNALVCLLIEDPSMHKKDSINSLYHDSSIPFKNEADIQHLISLIDAYQRHDIEKFLELYDKVKFAPQNPKYLTIYQNLLLKMKKEKLLSIIKSYQTIKFSYIAKKLTLNEKQVERIVFELITDEKIYGRINDTDEKNKFLQLITPRNQFLQIQAENLRELGRRYLS